MERGPKTAFANQQKKHLYVDAYNKWLKDNEDQYGMSPDAKLESELDGGYWRK